MSYFDTIILGYIINMLFYVLTIIFGLVVGFIIMYAAPTNYIFRIQKARVAMYELKEKMTPAQHKAEKRRTLYPLLFPFGMILPFFRILRDAIMTGFDTVDMSYINMQRLKDRYKI